MKKVLKKLTILVVMMAVVFIEAKFAYAENSKVQIDLASSSKLKVGETVTVDISCTKNVEEGIGSIMGKLNFDSNVLEFVSAQGKSDWNPVYVESTKTLGIERNSITTSTGKIATLTFKVKDNSNSNTTISYNINDVGLEDEVSLSPSITIYADQKDEEGNSQGTNNEKENTANPTNIVKNNIQKTKAKPSSLPKAGDTNIIIGILAGISALISTSLFLKIKIK